MPTHDLWWLQQHLGRVHRDPTGHHNLLGLAATPAQMLHALYQIFPSGRNRCPIPIAPPLVLLDVLSRPCCTYRITQASCYFWKWFEQSSCQFPSGLPDSSVSIIQSTRPNTRSTINIIRIYQDHSWGPAYLKGDRLLSIGPYFLRGSQ